MLYKGLHTLSTAIYCKYSELHSKYISNRFLKNIKAFGFLDRSLKIVSDMIACLRISYWHKYIGGLLKIAVTTYQDHSIVVWFRQWCAVV